MTCTQRFWLCPVDFRRLAIQNTDFYRPMHRRLLPEKGKIKFGGVSENGNVGNEVLKRKVQK